MKKIATDIDNTICNTSDFFGELAFKYDRDVLHKESNINFDKVVPRSDQWTKDELPYFMKEIFNIESINIPVREDASLYINKLKEEYKKILFSIVDYPYDYVAYLSSFKNEDGCPEATRPSLTKRGKYILEEDGFDLDKFICNK